MTLPACVASESSGLSSAGSSTCSEDAALCAADAAAEPAADEAAPVCAEEESAEPLCAAEEADEAAAEEALPALPVLPASSFCTSDRDSPPFSAPLVLLMISRLSSPAPE